MFFNEITGPISIIAAIFYILWIFKFPSMLWLSLIFRNGSKISDYAASVGAWFFLLGFVNTMVMVAKIFINTL